MPFKKPPGSWGPLCTTLTKGLITVPVDCTNRTLNKTSPRLLKINSQNFRIL